MFLSLKTVIIRHPPDGGALDPDSVVFVEEDQACCPWLIWLHVPHKTSIDRDLLPRCVREDAESSLHSRLPAFHRAYHGIATVLFTQQQPPIRDDRLASPYAAFEGRGYVF
jgi:hypothetical protein